jgi:hypothetical protein
VVEEMAEDEGEQGQPRDQPNAPSQCRSAPPQGREAS